VAYFFLATLYTFVLTVILPYYSSQLTVITLWCIEILIFLSCIWRR